MIVQKIKKVYESPVQVAIRYYSILSQIGEWKLPKSQIYLLAFTAVRGTISSGGAKESFVREFSSSVASIGNMISMLSERKLLVKKEGKTVVNPQILLDFSKPIIVQFHISYESKTV